MKRKIIEQLKAWKDSPRRKPLVLQGARQVGKTWIVQEFGRECYKHTAYINFEEAKHMRRLFEPKNTKTRCIGYMLQDCFTVCIA